MSAANELPDVWVLRDKHGAAEVFDTQIEAENCAFVFNEDEAGSMIVCPYVPATRLAALEREVAELREALRHEVIEPHTVVGRSYFGGYCVLCGHIWGDRPETHEPGCLAALRAEPTGERRE